MSSVYTILQLKNVIARAEEIQFKEPINWDIQSNEHWSIIGPNGSGKSILIDIILGKHALHHSSSIICKDENDNELKIRKAIRAVAFKDIYTIINTKESYYQQRWNKGLHENVSKVKDIVANRDCQKLAELVQYFNIEDLLEKEINLLSSGELRKFLIISSLLENPRILILDNPYIGLDKASKQILNDLFSKLTLYRKLQIFLIVSDPQEIPHFITNVLPIKDKSIKKPLKREDFLSDKKFIEELFYSSQFNSSNEQSIKEADSNHFKYAFELKNIHISYDNRTILKDLNWKVKKGEKWALLGPNGSGKTTLLSLINGDNPQAYANDISLFDRRRGTGESIWDIKKRIGYISPEMHLYYLKNVKCIDIVGSGFFDTIGLYQKCNEKQKVIARRWLNTFGIAHLEHSSFLNVSTGEQRLLLIARVLVKKPELLILDEPLHGLDIQNKQKVIEVIEDFCQTGKTLIYVTHNLEELPSNINQKLILKKLS